MTDKQITAEALHGPWTAYLADLDGFVYTSVADAIEDLGEDDEVRIGVARGSAAPAEKDGGLRLPGTTNEGDCAYEIEAYLFDGDKSIGAPARYAQAQAMAAGLNAAAGLPPVTVERPDDERIEVHINGTVVSTANHDEHGWSGMDAVEKTALAVARAFGAGVLA